MLADYLSSSGFIKTNKIMIKAVGTDAAIIIGELCSKYVYWEEREITILSVKDDSLLKYTQTVEKKNEHTTTGETLALLNQATQFTGERKATTSDS